MASVRSRDVEDSVMWIDDSLKCYCYNASEVCQWKTEFPRRFPPERMRAMFWATIYQRYYLSIHDDNEKCVTLAGHNCVRPFSFSG